MNYELSFRSEENHIYVAEWENREVKQMPEYVYTLPESGKECYFELEIGATWDDKFGDLIVRKVIGEGDAEQLVAISEAEAEAILSYIAKTCF